MGCSSSNNVKDTKTDPKTMSLQASVVNLEILNVKSADDAVKAVSKDDKAAEPEVSNLQESSDAQDDVNTRC